MTSLAMSQTANPELLSSAGESFSNSTYRLDWSVGECITATHSAGDYVLTQGFHQNTYVISAIEDFASDVNISVYPNPATDLLTIYFPTSEIPVNVKISLADINGNILQQAEVKTDKEQLNFSGYAKGVYFLFVKQESQTIKSFKIIKN